MLNKVKNRISGKTFSITFSTLLLFCGSFFSNSFSQVNQVWVTRYKGPGNSDDGLYSLAIDGSANVYVTGYSVGSGTSTDYATIKYNSAGVQQWVSRYNGPGNLGDGASSIAVDGSGNVYVAGYSGGSGTSSDYATIKYNSSGVQQWVQRYNGPGNSDDNARSLAVDGNSGNVFVTGSSTGIGTGLDYATIKYSQTVGITPVSSQIPDAFRLYQNYPNPFNPSTVVRFQLPVAGMVALTVFDVLGREVEILVNQELQPGTYEINWNATNYPTGIYYYTLTAGEFRETGKAVLVK